MLTHRNLPYLQQQGSSTQLIVDGRPFIMLGGEVHNSSGASLQYMEEKVWDKVVAFHCNTALVSFYWELIEPEEGVFDFTLVDGILDQARQRGIRMVPLWFGTWKNSRSTYAPAWVKTDTKRFPRVHLSPGVTCGTISPLSEEACEADARAFRALMCHLREVDSEHRTVIMMQVENEAGLLGAPRDYSPAAEAAFHADVPEELIRKLNDRKVPLHPEFAAVWEAAGNRSAGTWSEVFGEAAEEVFMAWHIGRYVNRVTQAGREEYPLPCFVNAWLVQYTGEKPGAYPSGGPVSRMRDIWKIAAPEISIQSPDIYPADFAGICADYAGGGNPLLIPEAKRDEEAASNVFYALGKHDAIGFAPFGIESMDDALFAKSYAILRETLPVIAAHHGSGRMTAILQTTQEREVFNLGDYKINIWYHGARQPGKSPAAAIIIAETPNDFIIVGHGGVDVNFVSLSRELPQADFVQLEEGRYLNGEWIPGRRLNGDELVVRLKSEPSIYRAKLFRYE